MWPRCKTEQKSQRGSKQSQALPPRHDSAQILSAGESPEIPPAGEGPTFSRLRRRKPLRGKRTCARARERGSVGSSPDSGLLEHQALGTRLGIPSSRVFVIAEVPADAALPHLFRRRPPQTRRATPAAHAMPALFLELPPHHRRRRRRRRRSTPTDAHPALFACHRPGPAAVAVTPPPPAAAARAWTRTSPVAATGTPSWYVPPLLPRKLLCLITQRRVIFSA
jgi:hypothetical protein